MFKFQDKNAMMRSIHIMNFDLRIITAMTTRIAIFRFSALGDCVLLLPSIRALQAAFPKSHITWIIESNLLPLFAAIEGVEFIAIKKPRSIKDYLALRQQLSCYEFDILLVMQASLRANLIYPFIKAKRKIGFDKVRGKELHGLFINERIPFAEEHLLDGFMAFANKLIQESDSKKINTKPEWNLTLDKHALLWAEQQLADIKSHKLKVLAINPAASKLERCCSAQFYAEVLVSAVKQFNCAIVITGGPAEWEQALAQEITERYSAAGGENLLNLVGKTTLPQLAAVLKQVDVLLAPDTGPIHIADALGTKVVGLYAVAPPALTGPYQNQNRLVDAYPRALLTLLNKQAHQVKWGTRIHHAKAMSYFTKAEVLEKLALCL